MLSALSGSVTSKENKCSSMSISLMVHSEIVSQVNNHISRWIVSPVLHVDSLPVTFINCREIGIVVGLE